ncbi:hypothetical protein H0H92_009913, partial [Tricholoma furcatifolium]
RTVGAVSDERWKAFSETRRRLEDSAELLKQVRLSPQGWGSHGFVVPSDGILRSGFEMLRYKDITAATLRDTIPALADLDADDALLSRIDIDGQYAAHLIRQEAELRLFLEDEALVLDPYMDYSAITGISEEVRERLARGAAKRMEGMTPASIVALLRYAKRTFRQSYNLA